MTPTLWALGAFATALIVVSFGSLLKRRSRRRQRREQRDKIERHVAAAARREFREILHERRMQSRAERSARPEQANGSPKR